MEIEESVGWALLCKSANGEGKDFFAAETLRESMSTGVWPDKDYAEAAKKHYIELGYDGKGMKVVKVKISLAA